MDRLRPPDVLCLQETKQADAAFPHGAFATLGYETAHHGDGRWNGVAIASRVGLSDVAPGSARPTTTQGTRLIAADCGGVRVHLGLRAQRAQPRQRALPAKLDWLARLRTLLDETAHPIGRWPSAVTSTWRPRTATSGTRPSS